MNHSFRNRLLVLLAGLLAITVGSTIFAVIKATNDNVSAILEEELAVADRVFNSLLEQNRLQLSERAALLAGDFAFKRAIATGETETIISVLANHGDRIAADMVLLFSPQGEVILSTHSVTEENLAAAKKLPAQSVRELVVFADGNPYQLVTVPVQAPNLIARVGLGFEISQDLLNRLKEIARADITLLLRTTQNSGYQSLSTLEEGAAGHSDNLSLRPLQLQLEEQGWQSRPIVLFEHANHPMEGLISLSTEQALADYQPLRAQIMVLGLLALVVAVVIVFFLARSISHPITRLTDAATLITRGNYKVRVQSDDRNEFGVLSRAFQTMQEAIAQRESHILFQASHDLLTGIPNRGEIHARLGKLLPGHSTDAPLLLCLLELDNLPELRDLYGNDCADALLKQTATRLSGYLDNNRVGRFADRQFLLLFEAHSDETHRQVADELVDLMAPPLHYGSLAIKATIKIGFALAPQQGSSADDLIRRLLIALSHAQKSSAAFTLYRNGDDERHLRLIQVTDRLVNAIDTGAFRLFYQPKYDLGQRAVTQVEALIRWTDSEMGFMPPDEFIPLAERAGHITRITRWVVVQALTQLEDWAARGLHLAMSINVSAQDVVSGEFIHWLIASVQRAPLDPSRLTIEVTESIVMTDLDSALAHLAQLRDAGLHISMDDFGTGFSSLAQLKNLPIHELKVDKSFVQTLAEDRENQNIVRATITLAHDLGLTVVAEGVENAASVDILQTMGCDLIQGYFLGKPMPSPDFEHWLANDCPIIPPPRKPPGDANQTH